MGRVKCRDATTRENGTALGGTKILGIRKYEYWKGVEGIVLRKGRDIGRRGGSGKMVVV